jgi:uncharacterized membrane protein
MQRSLVLYLVTLVVLVGLDALYLGVFAKEFFAAQVGDMMGDVRPLPAVLFYLLYVAGVLVFVSGPVTATVPSTLLYGALYGLFCYATFELTSLAMLRHWTWPVAVLDISWGVIVTAISATAGLLVANRLAPRG